MAEPTCVSPTNLFTCVEMNLPKPLDRIAVCSWSLRPSDLRDLLAKLDATGIFRIQLALDPLCETPERWPGAARAFEEAGVEIVSGMFGCVGEDYSTLETIRRTGGIAPEETWNENLRRIRAAAALASELRLKLVTFHAGFLPHAPSDPDFARMKGRLETVGTIFNERGIGLALETGQETAAALATLLRELKAGNVGVNFDPANMVLYDKGDPVEALRTLGPWIRQVHIKDARRTRVPGTWGEEVPAGSGDVDWPAFFAVLRELNYTGHFVIEREAGEQRIADIRTARLLIESIAHKPS